MGSPFHSVARRLNELEYRSRCGHILKYASNKYENGQQEATCKPCKKGDHIAKLVEAIKT